MTRPSARRRGSSIRPSAIEADNRPQPQRRRGDTVSLRGVANQQIFGSKRAFETVEDFTQFEERTAYFDDDLSQAAKKGFTFIDQTLQLPGMAEVQRLLDFPPAPKLNLEGRLDATRASASELRGQALFNGRRSAPAVTPRPRTSTISSTIFISSASINPSS